MVASSGNVSEYSGHDESLKELEKYYNMKAVLTIGRGNVISTNGGHSVFMPVQSRLNFGEAVYL